MLNQIPTHAATLCNINSERGAYWSKLARIYCAKAPNFASWAQHRSATYYDRAMFWRDNCLSR